MQHNMKTQWILDLAVPLRGDFSQGFDMEEWLHINTLCRNLCWPGTEISTGTGFGHRDMQFSFASQAEAHLAEVRLRQQASHLNFTYISIYEQPASVDEIEA